MLSSVLKSKWNPEIISKFDLVSLRALFWNRNLKLKWNSWFQFSSLCESEIWNLKSNSRFRFFSLARVWNLKSEIELRISISLPCVSLKPETEPEIWNHGFVTRLFEMRGLKSRSAIEVWNRSELWLWMHLCRWMRILFLRERFGTEGVTGIMCWGVGPESEVWSLNYWNLKSKWSRSRQFRLWSDCMKRPGKSDVCDDTVHTCAHGIVRSADPSTWIMVRSTGCSSFDCRFQVPFPTPERGYIIGHQSVEKSEIRSGASVKKVREAFQDSLSISGFAPSSPPLLETRGSDFRNARVQASISISGFDCISALGPLDFNFSPWNDLSHTEMQSKPRFRFQTSISEKSRKM